MDSSFDVRIYTIETNQRAKGASYTVRWKVGTKKHSKTYSGKALADARRSELMAAHKKGAPFSVATGLPISFSSKAADTNWYDFAVEYVDWKWPNASGNNRKIIAKVMTAVTVALLRKRTCEASCTGPVRRSAWMLKAPVSSEDTPTPSCASPANPSSPRSPESARRRKRSRARCGSLAG